MDNKNDLVGFEPVDMKRANRTEWTPEMEAELLRMKEQGTTTKRIAEHFHVSEPTIYAKLKKMKSPAAKPADQKQKIQDSGDRTVFSTGAVRDMHGGKGRMDLLPWAAIIEVSKHCEEGALKYGERNVERGIPIHSLLDSAMRHLAKYMDGKKDEPHLRAAAWNILFAIWMEIYHPELQDIPSRREADD